MEKPIYSLAEVRALVGVGRTTLHKAIRDGQLRAIKIGGRTLVLAEDLYRWLNEMPSAGANKLHP